jgi:hypothetical protein
VNTLTCKLAIARFVSTRSAFVVGLLVAAAGCASAPKTLPTQQLTVERLYPLRPGSVWTYDVDTGEGVPTLAITRVLSKDGIKIEVSSGSDPFLYEQRPDGLYRPDIEGYVLHAPVEKGASWAGRDGATSQVTDTQRTVVTPAGDFQGCVEVLESGGASGKRVRTVFCPDVGPVEIESSLQMALTGQAAKVVAKLRGYDFSAAVGAQP